MKGIDKEKIKTNSIGRFRSDYVNVDKNEWCWIEKLFIRSWYE